MKKRDGFTLIEVLVSIILFAIGVLGMMGLEVLATRGAVIGNNNTVANYLAQSLAGQLEQLPVSSQALVAGTHGYGASTDACLFCNNCGSRIDALGYCVPNQSNNYNVNNNNYTITWTATPVQTPNSTLDNLLSIAITVSWANGNFVLTIPSGHYYKGCV